MSIRLVAVMVVALAACRSGGSRPYDLVIRNGRVMDPESGLDQVRDVGVSGGRVAAIAEGPFAAKDTIDATGLVVAPGFIDIHSHSVPADGQRWQVRDGVTTALELEEGGYPVAEWLSALEGKSLINFGVSAGHIPARIAIIAGAKTVAEERAVREQGEGGEPPPWSHHPATADQLTAILRAVESGLDAGGLGIGFELNEEPGTSRQEVLALFELAKRKSVPIYAHLRSMGVDPVTGSMAGAQEVLADAVASGASTHFVHLGSSTGIFARPIVGMIEAARARGLDVTGEVYPYTAASTGIQTGFFDGDWRSRMGIGFGDVEWPPTGERLTEKTFPQFRKQGGAVIIHVMKEANVDYLVGRPGIIIASDAMPLVDGRGHPRGIGTFARVLGRYVREKKALALMEAIRKMTLLPAERVRGAAPVMARKGRIKVGGDADLTVFDPATVVDRATFAEPAQASAGIPFVVVNGTVVVRRGELVPGVAPGRAIKRGVTAVGRE
jgi:dihydroorotase